MFCVKLLSKRGALNNFWSVWEELRRFKFTFKAMGGPGEILLYAPNEADASLVAHAGIREIQRIEQKYSRYREESILSNINAAAGGLFIEVDEETAGLVNYAKAAFEQSSGLFDITSGILRRVWDFSSGKIPNESEIEKCLNLISFKKIEWQNPRIRLQAKGMEIDFGGVGKEYAVDRASELLWREGVRHGLVNLAGDLRVIGPRLSGEPWMVGIAHPRDSKRTLGTVALMSGALATSGDYQRYMIVDGKRFCHILNPQTGWPVDGMQSVTVLSESCLIAGTTSTIAMLLGEKQGKAYLTKMGLSHISVSGEGRVMSKPSKLLVKARTSNEPEIVINS